MELLSLYNLLLNIPAVYLIYFFYGAAFLFLGISISVKDLKASDLKLSNILWLLGMFGFVHGAHEWFQLYPLIEGQRLSRQEIVLVKLLLLYMFILSYFFLLQFGVLLISRPGKRWTVWVKGVPALAASLWVFVLWRRGGRVDPLFLWQVENGVRYTLGLMGGLIAGCGLIAYSHEIRSMSRPMARNFFYSGVAMVMYGLLAGIPDFRAVLAPIHLPVELLRGASAIFLSFFIIKALNIFNIETRQKTERQTRLLIQTEKLSSLGQMAAGIAHEINNPLTNVSLSIQTLKTRLERSGAEKEIMEKLAVAEKNIGRASAIARELLQFSRQRETDFVPLNINDVIRGALTLLGYKLKNVDVRQDLAPVPDAMGDRGKLEQVFINILSNSLEAMPEGGRISISSAEKNGLIEIKLGDTGTGIAAEHLLRVFDPFFTTKEVGAGTGLGLSLCYGIIKQHRGHIEVVSPPGEGTTVTITIPVREMHEEDPDRR